MAEETRPRWTPRRIAMAGLGGALALGGAGMALREVATGGDLDSLMVVHLPLLCIGLVAVWGAFAQSWLLAGAAGFATVLEAVLNATGALGYPLGVVGVAILVLAFLDYRAGTPAMGHTA